MLKCHLNNGHLVMLRKKDLLRSPFWAHEHFMSISNTCSWRLSWFIFSWLQQRKVSMIRDQWHHAPHYTVDAFVRLWIQNRFLLRAFVLSFFFRQLCRSGKQIIIDQGNKIVLNSFMKIYTLIIIYPGRLKMLLHNWRQVFQCILLSFFVSLKINWNTNCR